MNIQITHRLNKRWLKEFAAQYIAEGQPLPKTKKAFWVAVRKELRQTGSSGVFLWPDMVLGFRQPVVSQQAAAYIAKMFP